LLAHPDGEPGLAPPWLKPMAGLNKRSMAAGTGLWQIRRG